MAKIPTWIAVVAGALEDGNGRFLLQKRPLGKQHGGLWEFPGGKIEPGENPRNALVRELNEELTLIVEPDEPLPLAFAESEAEDGRPGIVLLLYRICAWEGNPVAEEGAEIGWFTHEEANRLAVPPLDSQLLAAFAECSE